MSNDVSSDAGLHSTVVKAGQDIATNFPKENLPGSKSSFEHQQMALESRETTADIREKTVDAREETVDAREETVDVREVAAHVREVEASSREAEVTIRENCDFESETLRRTVERHLLQLQVAHDCLNAESMNSELLTEQLRQLKLEMVHLAYHDLLTEVPNRIQLEERLSQSINWARRHCTKLAIIFLDIDRFKIINDSLGHSIGDILLKEVARRLATSIEKSDMVSRQAGDKFIILLTEASHLDGLISIVDRLHRITTDSYTIDGHILKIGVSIGLSIYPDDAADSATLIQHAEAAMYSAKENGRNSYTFFEKSMNEQAIARHGMETSLNEALEHRQFVLYYQTQIDLETGRVCGAEALIRWQHPVKGLQLPAWFLSFAEECGTIVPIGRWILRAACMQAKNWLDEGLEFGLLAVNICPCEFECKDFLEHVFLVLGQTGLPPKHLELELTEGVLMKDTDATRQKLDALRAMGIHIAIDDFGTGYSSLSYLKQFPVNTLKIDQSFVQAIRTSVASDILVDAVINIGKGLGHRVVAEGFETQEQLEFLLDRKFIVGQGFLLGTPIQGDDFAHVLKQNYARGHTHL